eukprot:CAMPEP_0119380780 /NCGR_PEP_ID=MMETSP1334-20130426/57925_1 /TAXON_ID=127549 /ORGANISM="Calcidiscus leptoporus, Strain RCC1130" /LENGTH=79 /DNA_ID=CAMNT_0007400717 /DNA_START=125 /DNA_END=365 /DNA_ORIENTATION=-
MTAPLARVSHNVISQLTANRQKAAVAAPCEISSADERISTSTRVFAPASSATSGVAAHSLWPGGSPWQEDDSTAQLAAS